MQTTPPPALVRGRPDGLGARMAAAQHTGARERARVRRVAAREAARRAQRPPRPVGARAAPANRSPRARHLR